MHVPRGSLRALGAAVAAGALLAAASTAHADVPPQRSAGVPGPPTLNPQPEPPGVLRDARAATRFSLTIDGVEIASFSELAGISPGDPAARNPRTVALKRGKNNAMEILAWPQSVVEGQPAAARKSCTLVMYAADGTPVARYHLESAWPAKIEIGGLKAGASEILYETVTVAFDDIQRLDA
ncbi:phage tail protein [Solirubrobacter ginsenosidimutans]|uniref:Phage tail protein n=1 Tax=Solirubrobacter ginsenosidimutans TaxID=490573 RepID=A0A9X3S0D5_9ACTN|nr:phage tail protein [Solirubrobacter ginsenosidimutans]MDA0159932.1 phage tail protein [Solirubrobacter ginsenosidimutans]